MSEDDGKHCSWREQNKINIDEFFSDMEKQENDMTEETMGKNWSARTKLVKPSKPTKPTEPSRPSITVLVTKSVDVRGASFDFEMEYGSYGDSDSLRRVTITGDQFMLVSEKLTQLTEETKLPLTEFTVRYDTYGDARIVYSVDEPNPALASQEKLYEQRMSVHRYKMDEYEKKMKKYADDLKVYNKEKMKVDYEEAQKHVLHLEKQLARGK